MDVSGREQAISTLEDGRAALDALAARLSDDELARPATIGGGDWSAKDLLGHIAFWEELALETIADWRAGRRPAVEVIGEQGEAGVDAANARNQTRTAAQSLQDVRARATEAHAAIVQAIRTMSDEEWRSPTFYPTSRPGSLAERLGRVLGGEDGPFRHAFDHLPDLRTYVESIDRG